MKPDFTKSNGLLPVIIQDAGTMKVLMLGYMDQEAYTKTFETGYVTFYSRSRKNLWTKGETSGNYLLVQSSSLDCDSDALLINVIAKGPTCHTGNESCFSLPNEKVFLYKLEQIIKERIISGSEESSYTKKLFNEGINKVAQKVGEEAVELIIEAKDNNIELFKNEAADLLFHLLILFRAKGLELKDIENTLSSRQ
ncbi:bifunctional phosphoribosyl-AMP cyclohydrolase/phosphoribosyl-ATP diphosphatase HisIE [Flavobacterium sp. AG291]|uniref:bifunctional phosphoribosyl-AMP cyclohydrolase/phosphoribosyl-ATP diphosphatase HisIE n=1 Tax=Flavobacterium sp. AG291 TaxID=2184000 RepID=UPI000E0CA326|nr:bifunctional phosphoribosyl-AMP cyclohydrolase/phosphoribosyl-ATP diphosphatase HisIE [Flavobacterium sp. AG291]RDI10489.1 phosphoribosyl-ATP pyrophosphatase /phosphoribosyl-AMP cyclohydrolase [Flavobacterium sp. AG291]